MPGPSSSMSAQFHRASPRDRLKMVVQCVRNTDAETLKFLLVSGEIYEKSKDHMKMILEPCTKSVDEGLSRCAKQEMLRLAVMDNNRVEAKKWLESGVSLDAHLMEKIFRIDNKFTLEMAEFVYKEHRAQFPDGDVKTALMGLQAVFAVIDKHKENMSDYFALCEVIYQGCKSCFDRNSSVDMRHKETAAHILSDTLSKAKTTTDFSVPAVLDGLGVYTVFGADVEKDFLATQDHKSAFKAAKALINEIVEEGARQLKALALAQAWFENGPTKRPLRQERPSDVFKLQEIDPVKSNSNNIAPSRR